MNVYKNGNHQVMIFENGTKISSTINPDDEYFTSDFPESIDLKITNKCNRGCAWCHENSSIDGKHGNINLKFIDTLKPYTEVAIGGGNPLEHPQLIDLLKKLKEQKIYANMTVNLSHFIENFYEGINIAKLLDDKLIHGLGVSYEAYTLNDEQFELFIKIINKYPNIVLHIIAGVMPNSALERLYDKHVKMLILGFKIFRRGITYNSNYTIRIMEKIKWLKDNLKELINHFDVVSFDNLAIKQLNVASILSDKEWDEFYQGNDGTNTMFIDLVEQKFAKNSISTKRYDILENIEDMFDIVKKEI